MNNHAFECAAAFGILGGATLHLAFLIKACKTEVVGYCWNISGCIDKGFGSVWHGPHCYAMSAPRLKRKMRRLMAQAELRCAPPEEGFFGSDFGQGLSLDFP